MGKAFVILVLVCVIGIGFVYWYKYRPDSIRQMCLEEQQVKAPLKRPGETFKRRVRSYHECLRENGLER